MYYIFQSDEFCELELEKSDQIPGIHFVKQCRELRIAESQARALASKKKHTKVVDAMGNERLYLYTVSGMVLTLNPESTFFEFARVFKALMVMTQLGEIRELWKSGKSPGIHYRPNLHRKIQRLV